MNKSQIPTVYSSSQASLIHRAVVWSECQRPGRADCRLIVLSWQHLVLVVEWGASDAPLDVGDEIAMRVGGGNKVTFAGLERVIQVVMLHLVPIKLDIEVAI